MKKLFNFLAVITATYLSLVLSLSLVLTNEKSLIFFSGLFFPDNLELKVKKSHWHPTKPFLEIDELSFKSEEEYLLKMFEEEYKRYNNAVSRFIFF